MPWNCKYKIGDNVKFNLEDKVYEGTIVVVDSNGTFFHPGEPSYDIMIEDDKYKTKVNKKGECLIKHVTQKYIL